MRRTVFAAAAAALLVAIPGCQSILNDADGPMTGTWKFIVTDYQTTPDPNMLCNLEATYVIRQEGNQMEGRSNETFARCRYIGRQGSWPEPKYAGVVRGPVENGRIDISDSGNWHCLAELHPTRIEGHLEIYYSIGGVNAPTQIVKSGKCVLERISDQGYDGPPA